MKKHNSASEPLLKAFKSIESIEYKPASKLVHSGYFLSRDSSAHWYIIPRQCERDWNDWNDLSYEDEMSWTVPEYAIRIGGSPSLVTFYSYEVKQ